MTQFFLVRHGETDTAGRSLVGWMPGHPLNENGRKQAESLAERLAPYPITSVYSSPIQRARETAAPIARRLRLTLSPVTEFGEWNCGAWEGLSFEELQTREDWQ